MEDLSALSAKPRLRLLLDHFSKIKDARQAWKVAYPLCEVLFLVVCGTIANCDDYEDIVDWGEAHLSFLRGFAEFHHGIPCADWLRTVMNRIDPDLFMACFSSWVAQCWPDKLGLVAIDGKTSRRSHNRATGQKPLHLVSAFATNSRLVLGQEAVDEKSTEITAIPALVERLDLEPPDEVERVETVGKDHGRFEVRTYTVSHVVDWYASQRSYPGAPRFPQLTTIAIVESRIERGDKIETEQRSYISSRALSAAAFADGARGHWGIENNLHWTLDVTFNEDQSRLRAGHGATNMAVVRHFALNLVRQIADKRSIKRRRKCAAWDPQYLMEILGPMRR